MASDTNDIQFSDVKDLLDKILDPLATATIDLGFEEEVIYPKLALPLNAGLNWFQPNLPESLDPPRVRIVVEPSVLVRVQLKDIAHKMYKKVSNSPAAAMALARDNKPGSLPRFSLRVNKVESTPERAVFDLFLLTDTGTAIAKTTLYADRDPSGRLLVANDRVFQGEIVIQSLLGARTVERLSDFPSNVTGSEAQ